MTRLVYTGTFLLWGALQAIGIAVELFVVQNWLVAKKLPLAVTSSKDDWLEIKAICLVSIISDF